MIRYNITATGFVVIDLRFGRIFPGRIPVMTEKTNAQSSL
jgi:hypothetical protein